MLDSLLIAVDLSPGSAWLLQRAARLSLAAHGRVTLLHVVPRLLSGEARARAEEDARALLDEQAAELSRAVPAAAVRPLVTVGSAAAAISAHAPDAQLIAMGRGGHGVLRDMVLGATAERVLRRSKVPVLVVRRPPEGDYGRPLLALDVGQPLDELLDVLLRVLPASPPPLAWVHAYEAPFEGFVYPSLTREQAREYREHYRKRAVREITSQVRNATQEPSVASRALSFGGRVLHGPPREVVPAEVARARADLLVLGTHAYSPVARAFVGTIAGDLLREVPCDALVVPPRAGRSEVETG